jgi:hypothetical protein
MLTSWQAAAIRPADCGLLKKEIVDENNFPSNVMAIAREPLVDRLLDSDNGSATTESLQDAARIVGRKLRLQLV